MSGISSWLWGTSQLDDAIDKATSELLPAGAEDIALNLEICDQIRSKSVPAKDAMRALKRRLNHKNPNVQLLALGLTDICIKNGGDQFLTEVASREFMDNLVSILKIPALNLDVKNTILRLIQNWSVAFEGKPVLNYVGQVYKNLSADGYKFPPKDLAIANSAMVDTQTAPEWIDSEVCLRCRTPFTFTNRKHHCRNCGQVFDQACSSKTMPLPHYGITQEVRVCEGCYSKLTKKADKTKGHGHGHRHSQSMHGTRHRSARDLADAELQRAIQLSLEEVGAANGNARPGYVPSWQTSEPPIVDRTTYPADRKNTAEEEDDPDLRAAIEASLREASAPRPSAPVALETPRTEEAPYSYAGPGYSQSYPPGLIPSQPVLPKVPNYDLEPLEADAILTFNQTVEQVQAQGGRDISRYPAVTELYDKANSLRPKLALNLDDAGRKEEMLSDMHDKLSQAVKLYDQLLSQQVAHPRWRAPQAVTTPPAAYQAATSSYSSYNPAYQQQWTSQQVPQAPYQQPQSPQMSSYSNAVPLHEQQRQFASPPPAEASQSQWYPQQQQPQQAYSEQQYAQQYASPPTPAAPQVTPIQASTPPSQQYTPQPQYQQFASPTPSTSQALPPVSFNTQPSVTSSAPLAPSTLPPASLPQSPPPQQQYAPSAPQASAPDPRFSPPLTRHNTVSYASSPPSAPANSQLARSNTFASPPHHQQQQQQYQQSQYQPQQHQQQPQYATSPPQQLPQFPVAPTSNPQSFPMYEPSIPAGIEQKEERKEALLIDL
ncbi:hypothetical protein BDQ12DRAFT_683159 [Crucibulum laeve]|uniref:Vacuolar protein sorting-associated protein 27 n=1 Tax=Crucibulum laeve TaxID=68775 RepID=A0A5C3LZY6_9AGAR|nr:hypothetical protein BDQ12DRAFT_683159 [Crucibulum laeve]